MRTLRFVRGGLSAVICPARGLGCRHGRTHPAHRAASRAHVTGWAGAELNHFAVATFITARDGVVSEMTEVWTDVAQTPSAGTRPA